MLSVDDAIDLCRLFAAMAGEYASEVDNQCAEAVERLLFDLQAARDEAEHYRQMLTEWGIPAKRRFVRKREGKGFEVGWQ